MAYTACSNVTKTHNVCSITCFSLSFSLLCLLSHPVFFSVSTISLPNPRPPASSSKNRGSDPYHIKVFVAELPRSLNYGLLEKYWSSADVDPRISGDPDHPIGAARLFETRKYPPYPENPLIKQHSAEYWIMGDLETPSEKRVGSFAKRVFKESEADVIYVPFFASLSAQMELMRGKGSFRKKNSNGDYQRQREVLDFVKSTDAWKRSGGRDHVFALADPVAMWHVREEIAPSILLVVDFGGWFRLDSKSSTNGSSPERIQHAQVSLLKDVIVPYMHLLPRLRLSENKKRNTLLYFKGAKHRHKGGLVREKLWDLLVEEPRIVMEEGVPNATGIEQSMRGMRSSEFCLHPTGDTPASCRLFDAIQSLCIPVVVSDNIELPFEGIVDYWEFSVFVGADDALKPGWLVQHLKSFSEDQKQRFRHKMAGVQEIFLYDNGYPGGIGPIPKNGAVNHIWKKVHQKLPAIKEAIARNKRKPPGLSMSLRCHCT